ncbi:hypothetical protein C8J56DRAFT_972623 [Mycena floridula]|nr:hypothetical protein C8J56DRAFT_972623 [Mycena floridula]
MLQLILPVIYSSVIFRCDDHCRGGLRFLLKHPYLARYIREFRIRCNSTLWAGKSRVMTQSIIIKMLEKLTPGLVNLVTFDWQGKQMPKSDYFWVLLRQSCPNLRNLSISVRQVNGGRAQPELQSSSKVFDFRGLVSFTIVIRPSFKHYDGTHPNSSLPPMFWEFLRENIDLEVINIETYDRWPSIFSDSYLDIAPLFQLQFPKLRQLSLGSFEQLMPLHGPAPLQHQCNNFLYNHLSLERAYSNWENFSERPGPMLPNLTHLGSSVPVLDQINTPITATSLRLRGWWGDFYCAKHLCNLTELTIREVRDLKHEFISNLRQYHPALRHLDISVYDHSKEAISLEAFSAFSLPDHLTTLRITTRKWNNNMDSLEPQAMLIFRHVESLQTLTVRYTYGRYFSTGYLRVGRFQRVSKDPCVIIAGHEISISKQGERKSLHYRSTV